MEKNQNSPGDMRQKREADSGNDNPNERLQHEKLIDPGNEHSHDAERDSGESPGTKHDADAGGDGTGTMGSKPE